MKKLKNYKNQNFSSSSSSAFFSIDCPDLNNSSILEFKLIFFNPEIVKEIAFIKLTIVEFEDQPWKNRTKLNTILDQYYKPKTDNSNLIKIENSFISGKYGFSIGFVFKKDLNMESPTFYYKTCYLKKEQVELFK